MPGKDRPTGSPVFESAPRQLEIGLNRKLAGPVKASAFSGADSHNLLDRCRDSPALLGLTTTYKIAGTGPFLFPSGKKLRFQLPGPGTAIVA
jgi:hypothetical protein